MRKGVAFAGALLFAALAFAAPVRAAQDRCLVLGPLAVSSYIAFLEEVAQGKRFDAARQGRNAADVIALYERLGCPQDALIGAVECLSSHIVRPAGKKPIAAVAQQCMEKAGMPTR